VNITLNLNEIDNDFRSHSRVFVFCGVERGGGSWVVMRLGHFGRRGGLGGVDFAVGLAGDVVAGVFRADATQQRSADFLVGPHAENENEHAARAVDDVGQDPEPVRTPKTRNYFNQPSTSHQ